MKNLCRLFSLLIVMIFFLSACEGGTGSPTSTVGIVGTSTPAGLTEDLQVGMLSDLTSNNVWSIFDQGGSTYSNQLVLANDYPTLYALTPVGDNLIPVLAADQPSEFTQEGTFYVSTVTLKNNLVWSDNTPITAYDVAFTIDTVQKFHLGFNWQLYYDSSILDHVAALDNGTVKFFFKQQPGLAKWKYGTLLGVIVNKNYWEPKMTSALLTLGDGTVEMAVDNARIALEKLSGNGEPVFGIYKRNDWQPGSSAVKVTNPESFFSHLVVTQFSDGTYAEAKSDGSYQWKSGVTSGTSAYKLISYTSGPYFNRVTFSSDDSDTTYLNLRNEINNLVFNPYGLPLSIRSELESDPKINILPSGQTSLTLLAINLNRDIFKGDSGLAFRKAISCMLDQVLLATSLLQNQADPAQSIIPSTNTEWLDYNLGSTCSDLSVGNRLVDATFWMSQQGFKWSIQVPTYNPSTSQENQIVSGLGLMDSNGISFPVLTLLVPTSQNDPLGATAGDYIASQLAKLGIPIKVENLNLNERLSRVISGDYDLSLLSYGVTQFPEYICTIFNNGISIETPPLVPTNTQSQDQNETPIETVLPPVSPIVMPVSPNIFGYSSLDLFQRCVSLATETNVDKINAIVLSIQRILATDIPVIPLYSTPMLQIYRTSSFPDLPIVAGPFILFEPHPLTQVISLQ